MKITNKDGWCIILLTAIQLGYSVNFNEATLQDYLTDRAPVPHPFIALLEKEAIHFGRQICLDGKAKEANKIAASINPKERDMNTYAKYCPNVYVAKCEESHEKGEMITVCTKYGKENECIVHNLVAKKDGFYYYSITRADGYNMQERAKKKAEQYNGWAASAEQKSEQYFDKSNKDRDFLSLGEPIKVDHYSARGHRKVIEDANRNMERCVEEHRRAISLEKKARNWEKRQEDINLSMPESLEYYKEMYEKAVEYHNGVKSGKYPREHAYTLTYAKKAVNELAKKVELATTLWG